MTDIRNPQFKERIEEYLDRQHFMKLVGIELVDISAGKVIASMKLEKKHLQQFGRVHGGVIATIADIAAGFAAYTLCEKDKHVVTGEIKISYFRPGHGDELEAIGTVIKAGKSVSFCEAEVWSVKGAEKILIAKATTSMVIIPVKEG